MVISTVDEILTVSSFRVQLSSARNSVAFGVVYHSVKDVLTFKSVNEIRE